MIAESLIAQFNQRFQHEKRAQVCLWFDEKGEFLRLMPGFQKHLEAKSNPPFRLLEYDIESFHGQIWIKHEIYKDLSQRRPGDRKKKRFVVYVPHPEERLKEPDENGQHLLDLLIEYKIAGTIWRIGGKKPSLFTFLRQAGVPLPDEPSEQRKLWDGGKDSPLAKYVSRFIDRPKDFWLTPLTLQVVQSRLVGDVDQIILDLSASPEEVWADLHARGLTKEFLESVRERYGLDSQAENPSEWIKEFASVLALTETFLAFGEPDDFPFTGRLPPVGVRQNHVHLLQRWLRDTEGRPVWDRWVREIETEIDLSRWAENRQGLSFAFPHLVRLRWKRIFEAFQKASEKVSETKAFFKSNAQSIRKEAEFARASIRRVGAWQLLEDLGHFLADSETALKHIEKARATQELVEVFTRFAPQVDGVHLRIRHEAMEDEIPSVKQVADRAYADYVTVLNQRFFDAYTSQNSPDIQGLKPVNKALEKEIWASPGKRAVVIVDGLRFDCAQLVKETLKSLEVEIEPLRGILPAVTPTGMTALLPLSGAEVGFNTHGNLLRPLVNKKDMGTLKNRLSHLKDFGADCREIEDIEDETKPPDDLGELLVVFGHEELDHIGHGNAEALIRHIFVETARLSRLVRKLHRWGYPEVHIVTDHGFMLVDEDKLPPEVPCDKAWCLVLKERFALVRAKADVPLKSFPFDFDPELRVAFPPGPAFFKAEKSFSHGGLTLQELIIPHLVSRVGIKEVKRVKIEVVLPTYTLMQSLVKVILRARTEEAKGKPQMKLFKETGRILSIDVLRKDKEGKRQSVLAIGHPKEVRIDADQNREANVTLFFQTSLAFQEGEILELEIQDAETEEQFPAGGIKLTVGRSM
jgi:hypothetical protein